MYAIYCIGLVTACFRQMANNGSIHELCYAHSSRVARASISSWRETHIQNLLKALPSNNNSSDGWTRTIHLLPLFFRLTMDSATEFLFGESVGSQFATLPGYFNQAESQKHANFTQALE